MESNLKNQWIINLYNKKEKNIKRIKYYTFIDYIFNNNSNTNSKFLCILCDITLFIRPII